MNKKLNKITVIILSIFMCCSFIFGVAYKFDWDSFTAKAENLEKNYKELSYNQLDMATYRTAESVTPAQITVFTHGLGGWRWTLDKCK